MRENEITNSKRHFVNKKMIMGCIGGVLSLGVVALGVYSFFGGSKASRYGESSIGTVINTITTPTDYAQVERDTNIRVENGILKVDRMQKIDKPMSEDGTWTILMYVCGTDLERVFRGATKDFNEIMEARFSSETLEKFNVIIQTGGSKEWKSNNISNEKIQRYKVVEGGRLKLIETLDKDSMGNPKVLSEFLEWGVNNYPAKHMGVIFWDHGAGPLKGVCADENYQNYRIASNGKNELMTSDVFVDDMLTLPEMEYSFAKTYKGMDSRFEFIGFDTCLSGSIECANVLAPYANYMIASAEIEPGDGWHYTPIMNYIIENPDCNGYDVGKAICNSYMNYYFNREAKDDITIATYDLGRIDNAMIELNYLVKYFNDMISKDKSIISKIMEMESKVVRFGNFKELVDIGSLITYIETTGAFDYNVTNLKHAFKEAVTYKKLSERYTYQEVGLMGITMYYPKNIISYSTFLEYRNISYSPYHMSFLEKMNYARYNYDWNSYIDYNWDKSEYYFERTFSFLDKLPLNIFYEPMLHNTMLSYEGYAESGFLEALYNNFSMYSPIHQGGFTRNTLDVKFEKNMVENEGRCIAKIEKESKKYVENVYATVFAKVGKDIYCLGENNRVKYNDGKGTIESSLKKEWFMLPDGQFLTTYITDTDTQNGKTIYSIPVLYNDTEMTIRIEEKVDKNNTYVYRCLGIWDATLKSAYAPRGYYPLRVGDVITPIYDVYVEEAQNYETEYGEDYTIESDFDFLFGKLPKGSYSYAYTLKCMNGYDIYSDVIDFIIE